MTHTKAKLRLMAVLVAVGVVAAACGNDDDGGSEARAETEEARLETEFDAILEAARQEAEEGTFTIAAFAPSEEDTHNALFEAFAERFDIPDFDGEWLPLLPQEGVTRIVSEAQAGRASSNVGYGGASQILELDGADLLEPFDWVAAFGEELPEIEDAAATRMDFEGLRGKAVVQSDEIDTLVYNTDLVQPNEVPESFAELTDDEWSEKLVLSSGGTPWHLLFLPWGKDRTLQVGEDIVANRPIFKDEGSLVPQAVAAGEAPIGVGAISQIETLKERGAPIDWAVAEEGLPTTVGYYGVLNNAPQPNLARLFVAWLVTEGAEITDEMEFNTRLTDTGSRVGQLLQERGPDAEVIAPTTPDELDTLFGEGGLYSQLLNVLTGTG